MCVCVFGVCVGRLGLASDGCSALFLVLVLLLQLLAKVFPFRVKKDKKYNIELR